MPKLRPACPHRATCDTLWTGCGADITPLRPHGAVSAYLSIMRGCGNFCSFCIVPHVRSPRACSGRALTAGAPRSQVPACGQRCLYLTPLTWMWLFRALN